MNYSDIWRESADRYICAHRGERVETLALQLADRDEAERAYILRQIEGWQRLRTKVPTWAETEGLLYPPRLSTEQCSSEASARYKADIARRLTGGAGGAMADLTGGAGVDFSFMARGFDTAVYVERRAELCLAARHNFPLLGLPRAVVVEGDGTDYLRSMERVDLIFLDPARRDAAGRKTVRIEDCEPDAATLLPLLRSRARYVMIKLSPMLDLSGALRALPAVSEVHIVAVGGECKELLLVIGGETAAPIIYIREDDVSLSLTAADEAAAVAPSALAPEEYLYEPGAAVMKAGAFRWMAERYGLKKLHANSHLYTASHRVDDFPGRAFRVEAFGGFGKRELRSLLADVSQANLAVRNFPATVAELRRRLRLREGGDVYLFATTAADGRHLLIKCRK